MYTAYTYLEYGIHEASISKVIQARWKLVCIVERKNQRELHHTTIYYTHRFS